MTLLALPALGVAALDVAALGGSIATYANAGRVFLLVLSPSVGLTLLALVAYGVLRWELKYLASAMILGPFTLLRPYVATAAVVVVVIRHPTPGLSVSAGLALVAVLLVEPLLCFWRLWPMLDSWKRSC